MMWAISENGTPTLAGILFSKMPCGILQSVIVPPKYTKKNLRGF
jgi:hypothetical protein